MNIKKVIKYKQKKNEIQYNHITGLRNVKHFVTQKELIHFEHRVLIIYHEDK